MKYPFIARSVFENVFWPAAAGNVFWSLCSVLLDGVNSVWTDMPKILLLLVISTYLTLEWLRLKSLPEEMDLRYWVFEYLHLLSITLVAIVAAYGSGLQAQFMAGYFIVTLAGILLRAWDGDATDAARKRKLVVANLLGLVIVLFGHAAAASGMLWISIWTHPLAFGVTLVLWLTWIGRFGPEEVEKRIRSSYVRSADSACL